MATMTLGAFADRNQADEAIVALEKAGVQKDDFSLVMEERKEGGGDGATKGTERSAAGTATAGGIVGGLAGLTLGAIATAGMLVAGPVALLAGLGWIGLTTVTGGAVGAAAGGIVGALTGLGMSESEAKRHESIIKDGGVLIGAEDKHVSSSDIRKIMDDHAAEEVSEVNHEAIPARLAAA